MVFITLPGRPGRIKRFSGRFGGKAAEQGNGIGFEFGDHKPMLRDRRFGRQNLVSIFEPEPPAPEPPKKIKMVYAGCHDGRVTVIFEDGTPDCYAYYIFS